MASLTRRKKLQVNNRIARLLEPGSKSVQDLIVDGYAPAQMIQDLRKYRPNWRCKTRLCVTANKKQKALRSVLQRCFRMYHWP